MRIILFFSIVILSGCSHISQPKFQKYNVRMWSNDYNVNANFSQIMTLVEKDKDKLIFLVNNVHFDTLIKDGKKVSGSLHTPYLGQAHIYHFEGVIVKNAGKEFLINGMLKDDQSGNSLNYEIY